MRGHLQNIRGLRCAQGSRRNRQLRLSSNRHLIGSLIVVLLAGCNAAQLPKNTGGALFGRAIAPASFAFGYKTLHSFRGGGGGELPVAGLTVVGGKLYGDTFAGGSGCGSQGCGTAFVTSQSGQTTVFLRFPGTNSSNTAGPYATLLLFKGTLYGTTSSVGYDNLTGTVFQLSLAAKFTILHTFSGKKDGGCPSTPLIAVQGELYGTSEGCEIDAGTIFKIDTAGKERTIYDFSGGKDGSVPTGLLSFNGEMYGATYSGGQSGWGTLFKTNTSGRKIIVHTFKPPYDGQGPEASMMMLGGELYGTTAGGGTGGWGTVYQLDPVSGREIVIHSFVGSPADGATPEDSLVAVGGNLYGTTSAGGVTGAGTVFEISPSGSERIIHNFAGDEGQDPRAALVELAGRLYGTTYIGGQFGLGTIFRINP